MVGGGFPQITCGGAVALAHQLEESVVSRLDIAYRAVADLRPRVTNPRTHSRKQLEQIARSITRFGFTNPVLVDDDGGVIAGQGRLEAARTLGMTEVPTIHLSSMSEADRRAYVIADNRIAENAGWDRKLLSLEFQYLDALELDFDLSVTGFEFPEIEALIDEASKISEDTDDRLPPMGDNAVSRPGDIWRIGPHQLICADATRPETFLQLLGEERAGLVFSDPPYNVAIGGHVSGLGKVKHREFAMASGEMTSEAFADFLRRAFTAAAKASRDGAIHFQCIDWRHAKEMIAAGEDAYSELKNICVWTKTNGGMGSLYRSAHELVFVWKVGRAPHVNNVELGRHGRYRTNVWSHAGANSFGATRQEDLENHPTVKPVAMVMDAILDCSQRGDIVVDPFAGSGTTLIAAHRTKRRGFGIELDPIYCDLIVRRLQTSAKAAAVLVADGRTFDAVATDRGADNQEKAA